MRNALSTSLVHRWRSAETDRAVFSSEPVVLRRIQQYIPIMYIMSLRDGVVKCTERAWPRRSYRVPLPGQSSE